MSVNINFRTADLQNAYSINGQMVDTEVQSTVDTLFPENEINENNAAFWVSSALTPIVASLEAIIDTFDPSNAATMGCW